MTEPRGRTARWTNALLLVPGSAALCGAAVWWAAGTSPAASTTTPQPEHRSAVAAHRQAAREAEYHAALQRTIAAHRTDSARLAHRLAALRVQIKQARKAEAAARSRHSSPVVIAPVYNTGPSSSGGGGARIALPPPPPAVAPPPPPPVHAVTGPSGP